MDSIGSVWYSSGPGMESRGLNQGWDRCWFAVSQLWSPDTFLQAFLLMASHQHVQQKVHAELDATVGRSVIPKVSDKFHLPYTEATLMEIHRFASIVPLGVTHAAAADTVLEGYDIPKGVCRMPASKSLGAGEICCSYNVSCFNRKYFWEYFLALKRPRKTFGAPKNKKALVWKSNPCADCGLFHARIWWRTLFFLDDTSMLQTREISDRITAFKFRIWGLMILSKHALFASTYRKISIGFLCQEWPSLNFVAVWSRLTPWPWTAYTKASGPHWKPF